MFFIDSTGKVYERTLMDEGLLLALGTVYNLPQAFGERNEEIPHDIE